jgi:hypothetical protein
MKAGSSSAPLPSTMRALGRSSARLVEQLLDAPGAQHQRLLGATLRIGEAHVAHDVGLRAALRRATRAKPLVEASSASVATWT